VKWPVNDLSRGLMRARGSVFHYTSSVGLLGCISNGLVWASQASGLNDRAEVRLGWEVIRDWLKRPHRTSFAIDLLRDMALDPLRAEHEVFVLSGSTHGDDANQWRLYADNGRGYAIEFAAASALTIFSRSPRPETPTRKPSKVWLFRAGDSVSVTPWFRVLYGAADTGHAVRELARGIEFHERQISRTARSGEHAEFLFDALKEDAYEALATIAHLVKTDGFAGEHEVRVVATYFSADEHIQYRPGRYGIVGYAELATAPRRHQSSEVLRASSRGLGRLPVRSVRLGPLLGEEHQQTVEALLRKYGYTDTSTTRSAVPLR
jgi:Protein of unknown function (DUF2971)